MSKKEPTCEERIGEELEGRIEDLSTLWKAYQSGEEEVEDLGNIFEYGLCFDYVPGGMFKDQEEAFFRYQLSTGGPGDEFRFFANPDDLSVHRIEYWFLDWYDGASVRLTGADRVLLEKLWEWFKEGESPQAAMKKAAE